MPTLNEELSRIRKDFILKYNLSCSTCENWEKNRKGKCASKAYCIVRDNSFNCAYRAKKTTFRKDWRVFFDPSKGQTFTVSDAEYAVAEEKYKEAVQFCAEMRDKIGDKIGVVINPTFEIKGHLQWIYRFDEDYTEEINKYESTHSKS